ncbi:MAG TPA: hypothetical protein VGG10_22685 [Rhizomicrobium sp.]|jgi:hypothetical protein
MQNAFKALDAFDWEDIRCLNPRGMSWGYASANALRRIVLALDRAFLRYDSGVAVALDDMDKSDSEPKHLIILKGAETTLVKLRFRDKLTFVGSKPVYTAHDRGVELLANAIVNAVRAVIAPA